MSKLSKEFMLELGEFARFPGELVMACMLMAGVDVGVIREFGLSLPAPLITDFARLIANSFLGSDDCEIEITEEAIREFRSEYPELAEYLKDVCYDDSDSEL